MMDFGLISFASPWVLLAALTLPAIWLLLRMTPPAVARIIFPAVRLMADLKPTERTPARTPWWLVALRMLIAALVIFGLAEPILNAQRMGTDGPVVVVVDDTWAAAQRWSDRQNAARSIAESAEVRGRPVMLITTSAKPPGDATVAPSLNDARDALGRIAQLQPQPWGKDLAAVEGALANVTLSNAEVFWLTDGLNDARGESVLGALGRFGSVTVITGSRADNTVALSQPNRAAGEGGTSKVELGAKRFAAENARPPTALTLRATDASGAVLAEAQAAFASGDSTTKATVVLPNELANRIVRFDVAGMASAAATALADDRWQQRPVGIFAAAVEGTTAPLLEDGFYLAQALAQTAEVRVGNVTDLLSRPLSMLAISGGQRLSEEEAKKVSAWIESGGLLLRFAGPRLDPAGDTLLPIKVRDAGRSLGGALSWGEPAGLGPFPDRSPFAHLPLPDDVKVTTQILAEPSPELPDRTWARLSDGTPLITAERRGAGWLVLFHVTATPEWSNLPLSGLFVAMLRTMLDLSQGVTDDNVQTATSLPPVMLLDGLGRLVQPGPTRSVIAADQFATTLAGPTTPPGLYGTARTKFALNLGPAVWAAEAMGPWPVGTTVRQLDTLQGERDLKSWILLAALALLLADLALSFALRGLMPTVTLKRAAPASMIVIVAAMGVALFSPQAQAQPRAASDAPLDQALIEGVLQTRLAYIATGSGNIDRVAQSGLQALTQALAARTSAEMATPARIDLAAPALNADTLMPYPLIYWRVTPEQPLPSGSAVSAINEYFRHGGMIVFDAPGNVGALGSEGGSAAGKLREVLARIDIPPLTPLRDDHVLTRSFYLLPSLPGRYSNSTVYVERGSSANDGVSSVIIGGQDWAAAWARDESGAPLYPVVPGGEQQREYAFRAGVNMVMYALTGNYKADQVHLPAIMQRLTQ